MVEVKGKYNTAKIFATIIEDEAISQIYGLLNCPAFEGSNIAFMPDAHAGAGCVIGTTMTIKDKVCPNLVGVDIGCGMLVAELGKADVDLKLFDEACHNAIKSGRNIYDTFETKYVGGPDRSIHIRDRLMALKTPLKSIDYIKRSIGSLGGGNHFLSVEQDDEGNKYIIIHSGSRYLGKEIANYHQAKAWERLQSHSQEKADLIKKLKAEHREKDIQAELAKLDKEKVKVAKDLAYVEGEGLEDYLHDVSVAQEFADYNRKAMLMRLLEYYNKQKKLDKIIKVQSVWTTVHNYIDLEHMILRKGSVSAQEGEKLIIPMNMKDGSLICIGKGNKAANYSAPHGAGRIMSRSKAKERLDVNQFKKDMEGIYTTTVGKETIDESPRVYKPMKQIVADSKDLVEVVGHIKTLANFKACE